MEVSMEVQGIESLIVKLHRLGGNVDEALDNGVAEGAQIIQREAKSNCPYDTGRLMGSIACDRIVPKTYAVGTDVEYAIYVEYGTGLRGDPEAHHTMSEHGRPPTPYLRPAFLNNVDTVTDKVRKELIRAIREAIGH